MIFRHRSGIAFVTGLLALGALAAAMLIVSLGSAAGTQRYVATTGADTTDCSNIVTPCLTITYAISQSVASDTINVGPGTYAENPVVPAALIGLTLSGAQAGIPVAGRIAAGPLESTINGNGGQTALSIQAGSVIIDGFSITDTRTTFAVFGIDIKSGGGGSIVRNNIIDTITTADPGGNGTAQGVYLDGGPDSVTVTNNRISNVSSVRSAKAILVGDSGATSSSDNNLITGNTLTNITSTTRGSYAVQFNNVVGQVSNTVSGNTISTLNGGGWVHAIGVEGPAPAIVVSSNNFSGLVSTGAGEPIAVAVWFEGPDTAFPAGLVNQNNFNYTMANNAAGIAVDPALAAAGSVDGTCNWWGDVSGPGPVASGTGAYVSNNVTYSPFLIAPAPAGPCGTPTPSPTPTFTPTPTPTATPTDTPTPSPVVTTPVPTNSPTPSPIATTPAPTNSPVATTPAPTNSPVATTPAPTNSPVATTPAPTASPSPTALPATQTPNGTPAVGGFVDVTTGPTGSGGVSMLAVLALIGALAVLGGGGAFATVRRRD